MAHRSENENAADLLSEMEALKRQLAALENRLRRTPTPEPTGKVVRRQALRLGVLALVFGLIGRARARAADALTIDPDGATIYAKYINFGNRLGALVKLWDPEYELGIQPNTVYARSHKNFAWYKGGKFVNEELKPGEGGLTMMSLSDGNLRIYGTLTVSDKFVGERDTTVEKLTVTGDAVLPKITGPVQMTGPAQMTGKNTLEFGVSVQGKQTDAGKIGYQVFTNDALDIVGAGTTGADRKIKMWAEGGTTFNGPVTVSGSFVTAGVENLRMIRGIVNVLSSKADRFAGTGFAVNRSSTGVYDIEFTPAFPSVPAATATQIYGELSSAATASPTAAGSADRRDNAVIAHLSANWMRVKTGGGGGQAEDRSFSFIVIGTR